MISGKSPGNGLDDRYYVDCKKIVLATGKILFKIAFVHYKGLNSHIFVKSVETYKFKTKDSERNTSLVCLDNILKIFFSQ